MEEDVEFGLEESVPDIFSPTIMSDSYDVLSIGILKPVEDVIQELWLTSRELDARALLALWHSSLHHMVPIQRMDLVLH